MGDCAMVQFGILKDDPDHRFHAIACAVMIKKLTEKINVARMRTGAPAIFFRIGINSGEMMAGNMGSIDRMQHTVIGDTVNTASRLEGVTKEHRVQAFVSEPLLAAAGYTVPESALIALELRGLSTPLLALPLPQARGLLQELGPPGNAKPV